ncbi:B3 domain-containing protein REM20-like [Salvia divinorum]|uniref:B3 domain-containing protein REM20-like n=1 Tax=Salvia divinorum TaxID=28513 RepID=A0ABD1G197_SALDI
MLFFLHVSSGDGVPYNKKPTFMKLFSATKNNDRLRIPPEFIGRHGSDHPFHCKLIMPNDRDWSVHVTTALSKDRKCG